MTSAKTKKRPILDGDEVWPPLLPLNAIFSSPANSTLNVNNCCRGCGCTQVIEVWWRGGRSEGVATAWTWMWVINQVQQISDLGLILVPGQKKLRIYYLQIVIYLERLYSNNSWQIFVPTNHTLYYKTYSCVTVTEWPIIISLITVLLNTFAIM